MFGLSVADKDVGILSWVITNQALESGNQTLPLNVINQSLKSLGLQLGFSVSKLWPPSYHVT